MANNKPRASKENDPIEVKKAVNILYEVMSL